MKVIMIRDEIYPYYDIEYANIDYLNSYPSVDVPQELILEHESVMKSFWDIQNKLEEYYKKL